MDGQVFPVPLKSYTAVRVYGHGHVVAYNYVAHFHDGIDVETYGNPDGSDAVHGPLYPARKDWDRRTVSIDFYNNYMTNFHDNSIESTARCTISGSCATSCSIRPPIPSATSRSSAGRSIGCATSPITRRAARPRLTSGSAGVFFLNNTIFTEFAQRLRQCALFNNLMLGQNSQPAILAVTTYTNYSSSDYNGFRLNPGAEVSFRWNVAPLATPAPAAGSAAAPGFATLADYVSKTGQDQHSVTLDYDVFVNVPKLDRNPKTVQRRNSFKDVDFRLRPGSAAIDRGVALPNVNDGFAMKAPDLGRRSRAAAANRRPAPRRAAGVRTRRRSSHFGCTRLPGADYLGLQAKLRTAASTSS